MSASDQSEDRPVISPFSDVEDQTPRHRAKSSKVIWIVVALIGLSAMAIAGVFVSSYLNGTFRTWETFPVSKYLESHQALAGLKFRGDLRVENDLGWKDGVGRLMVFTVSENPQPIVVLIPPSLSQIYFTKGQRYEGELEVKEGGLIYANQIRKN